MSIFNDLDRIKCAIEALQDDLSEQDRKRTLAEIAQAEAVDLLCDCAGQFLMSKDDGTVHHSFMATEEALCRYLVQAGRLVEVGHGRFKWLGKETTPTGQEKTL